MVYSNNWDIEFVNSAEEADVVVLWLFPKSAGLFGSNGNEINIELSKILQNKPCKFEIDNLLYHLNNRNKV